MKKYIALILTAVLMLNLCPSFGASGIFDNIIDVSAAELQDKPVPILRADDFETQAIGSYANGFWPQSGSIAKEFHLLGDVIEKDGNKENKAISFRSNALNQTAALVFVESPIAWDFVLDFSYNLGTAQEMKIGMRRDIDDLERERFLSNSTAVSPFITFGGGSVAFNNMPLVTDLDPNAWHRFQMHVDMETYRTAIYVDGKLLNNSLSFPSAKNITSFTFASPPAAPSGDETKYYLDDLKVYIHDEILTDEEFGAELERYKASGLMPDPRYTTDTRNTNSAFIFNMFHGEFVMAEGGRRIWKDDRFYDLPINMMIQDGKTLVPLRAFAEMMGATVDYNDGVISVSYKGETIKLVEGSGTYYVNGRASKLDDPVKIVKGHAVMNMDILCNFFDLEYESIKRITAVGTETYALISFSGELVDNYPLFNQKEGSAPTRFGEKRTDYEDKLIRMYELVRAPVPDAEEILARFKEQFPTNAHPRYLIKDFDVLKEGLNKGDPLYNQAVANYIKKADVALSSDIANPEKGSWVSSYSNAMKVSFAWNMTRDQKYLDWINRQADLLYEFMQTTNLSKLTTLNGLTNANCIHGVAIMYDWAYNDLDQERREKLSEVIQKLGVALTEYTFRSAYYSALVNYYTYGNQNIIRSTGFMAACLAVMDEIPDQSSRLLQQVIRGMINSFGDFYPSGAWAEGISYWQYCMDTLPFAVTALREALGSDFGFYDLPGVSQTTNYPLSVVGATGTAYPTGDGNESSPWHSAYMFEAKMNNDKAKAMQYRPNLRSELMDIINWVFITPEEEAEIAKIPTTTDGYMGRIENMILKTGNEASDTTILLHGGAVNDGHAHEDCGFFQFDMLGYRWAADLGREDYNLYQYGDYEGRVVGVSDNKPATGYTAFDYYRDNAEGHNTVFAGLGDNRQRMVGNAKTKFVKHGFSDTVSYGLLDMTETNANFTSAIRGVKLNKIQNEIIIHDWFQSKLPTDFHWGMHTQAEVTVAEDGKSAILSRNNGGLRIWMGIINDCDYKIKDMPAVPYESEKVLLGSELNPDSVMRPEGYDNIMVRPPLESTVIAPFKSTQFASGINEPFRRITIETEKDTTDFNLMVAFKPLVPGQDVPSIMPEATPMELWTVQGAPKAGNLDQIFVDGEPIEGGITKGAYNYSVRVLTNESPIPTITATANEKYDVEITQATSNPGTATITLKENGQLAALYFVGVNPMNDLTTFVSPNQLPLYGYEVLDGYDTSTLPESLFDNDPNTRFATDVQGGYVILDLGSDVEVAKMVMSFNNSTRKEKMKIEYSSDKENWKTAFEGTESGTTTELQDIMFASPVTARYIKVSFFGSIGNTSGNAVTWASITEMWAYSK